MYWSMKIDTINEKLSSVIEKPKPSIKNQINTLRKLYENEIERPV